MTAITEYALMAGASYITNRSTINQLPAPQGWTSFFHVPDSSSPNFLAVDGFEAVSFINGDSGEIVISYAGTDPDDLVGNPFDGEQIIGGDAAADLALANGILSSQLVQAAEYYLNIKAKFPNATITLTGHSLGGGLAALIAVMFDEAAYTFDQAPFLKSAQTTIEFVLDSLSLTGGYVAAPASAAHPFPAVPAIHPRIASLSAAALSCHV